jgi:hypothetical protein
MEPWNALGGMSVTQETLAMMKGSLGTPTDRFGRSLQKGVTMSTGLTWYDLQAPAKNIYPTITPLRNSIPRVKRPDPGDAARWKRVTSLIGSGWDSMGWVPEGQRSGTMSYQTANCAATYVTLGEEDFLTFEAEAAAEGFEDENAMVTFRLLQKTMRKEEIAILGGNSTLALGTPAAAPTLAVAGTTGTLPAATYSVIAVPLTLEGYKNSSLANGVATSKTITGADGKTYTLNGGSGMKSAAGSQAVTLGQILSASVAPITGAIAWAWYVGVGAGNELLQAITGQANATFSVPLTAGRQNATAVTADSSRNVSLGFDGLLTVALNGSDPFFVSGNAAANPYVNYVANGQGLHSSGRGSINEIDQMMQTMWDQFNLGPTVLYVNSQEQKNITAGCLTSSSGPLLRYQAPITPGDAYGIVAGGVIDFYYNPYAPDGGYKLPVKLHPDVPPGTILGYCEKLPPWYQSNEIPNVAEMLLRRDYYRVDWPLRTRQREYGIYMEEVLGVYAPFAMGVISNLSNTVS